MKRTQFIKLLGYGTTALVLLPNLAIARNRHQEKFSEEMLTGKGNLRLVGSNFQLIDDAYLAFEKMKTEALKSGINLHVVSGYRNFDRQKQIWNRKYNEFTRAGLTPINAIIKIVEYSTIPGTSRHHWGTDLDIIDTAVPQPQRVLQEEHFHGEGAFCRMKEWMDQHAESFGFYEVYTNNPDRKGFKYEPWHFSYAPLSIPMLKQFKNLNIKSLIENSDINGSPHFTSRFIDDYINEHILDIHPFLLP